MRPWPNQTENKYNSTHFCIKTLTDKTILALNLGLPVPFDNLKSIKMQKLSSKHFCFMFYASFHDIESIIL